MFIASFRLKTAVQQLLCTAFEFVDFARQHPVREMRAVALQESVEYIRAKMPGALGVYTPRHVLDIALKHVGIEGYFLEFGVFKGGTIRYIASHDKNREVHGFDSFEGLPDSWSGNTISFSAGGRIPTVPANVQLHPGWFDASLPKWLSAHQGQVAFIHIDCDIYSSTKTLFDNLAERIEAGTVIVFDEYFGYPNWQQHEFKAFQEFVQRHKVKYDYLSYSRLQVAIRITEISVAPQ